jgi:hypothetical protein
MIEYQTCSNRWFFGLVLRHLPTAQGGRGDGSEWAFVPGLRNLEYPLWILKTSSTGWIDAKRAVERQPY